MMLLGSLARARAFVHGTALVLFTALLLAAGSVPPATAIGAAPPATAARPVTYEVRVLVIDDGSPMVGAIADRLAAEGQPFDRIDLNAAGRTAITAETLATTTKTGVTAKYTGIVTPNEAPSQLSADERATLQAYGSTFRVREVAAYTWAHPEVGLNYAANPGYVGPVDGMSATLTAEARAGAFSYLNGTVAFDDRADDVDESWGYLATPLSATETSSFTPLLTAPIPGTDVQGSLIGVHRNAGHERLIITFGSNQHQQHSKVLSHGIVTWLTRGVSLTYQRNYFSAHIDDIYLASDMWNSEGNCTTATDCDPARYPAGAPGSTIRMTPADVEYLAAWQARTGIKLDMTFNGDGAAQARTANGGRDALEDALLARKSEMRWINHTWSHKYLGCTQNFATSPWSCATNADGSTQYMSRADITAEIAGNKTYARNAALPNHANDVLVTGQHSGLRTLPQMEADNPNLAGALSSTGIKWIASDASREQDPRQVGPATTVPRYPMNIFYNNAFKPQAVDEYNWIYTSRADGGSGLCEDNPATSTCIAPLDPATGFDGYIVPLEARIALGHALGNDPRPHFAHQANLAGDRLLYPVIDRMAADYRSIYAGNTPLLNPTMQAAGAELVRQRDWAQQQGSVKATLTGTTLKVKNTGPRSLTVPITVPESSRLNGTAYGTSYAGQRSGTSKIGSQGTAKVALGSDPGFATTATWPPAPAASAAQALTPQPSVERQDPTAEVELPEAITLETTDR